MCQIREIAETNRRNCLRTCASNNDISLLSHMSLQNKNGHKQVVHWKESITCIPYTFAISAEYRQRDDHDPLRVEQRWSGETPCPLLQAEGGGRICNRGVSLRTWSASWLVCVHRFPSSWTVPGSVAIP